MMFILHCAIPHYKELCLLISLWWCWHHFVAHVVCDVWICRMMTYCLYVFEVDMCDWFWYNLCFVDDTDDKENEISNYCSMDTTFDLPCQSNLSSYACNVEDNKNDRRKRSFSCPYEGTDKEGLSKALVLSQTPKLTTSSASHLHSTKGILLIILPIILFSVWVCNLQAAFNLLISIMLPVAVFVNHVHTIKIMQ